MLEAYIRPFELTTRRPHAHLKHVLGRRRANLSNKHRMADVPTTPYRNRPASALFR